MWWLTVDVAYAVVPPAIMVTFLALVWLYVREDRKYGQDRSMSDSWAAYRRAQGMEDTE